MFAAMPLICGLDGIKLLNEYIWLCAMCLAMGSACTAQKIRGRAELQIMLSVPAGSSGGTGVALAARFAAGGSCTGDDRLHPNMLVPVCSMRVCRASPSRLCCIHVSWRLPDTS